MTTLQAHLARIAEYNRDANAVLLTALSALDDPPEKAVAAFQHVLATEQTWLGRLTGQVRDFPLWGTPDLETCREWAGASEQLRAFVAALDDGQVAGTFSYRNLAGTARENEMAAVIQHVMLHSAQYRGEALGAMASAGHTPPDVDFIFWDSGDPRFPQAE
jgi:uncharacterized damage-inducible protein DinB